MMPTANKRKVLGRGLDSLIPLAKEDRPGLKGDPGVLLCPIEKIAPNPNQPRQSFDEQRLQELTESVRAQGVIHPLIVCERDGQYQIVAGERRWRAAKLAGLKLVPVVIKNLSAAEVIEIALIENIQREDLNPLEEAEAYRQLIEEHGITQEQLAARVGRQRSSVANMLRLLKLPDEVQRSLLVGDLTMGHARAILGISGAQAQIAMARKVVEHKLSVREIEELVRQTPQPASKGKKAARKSHYSAEEFSLIESIQRVLGTKVDLKSGAKKGGKLIIHYYSPEDLDRIMIRIDNKR